MSLRHIHCCSVWAQVLNRAQTKLQTVLIPLAMFVSKDAMDTADITLLPTMTVIYEETSDIWVNVSVLHRSVTSWDSDVLAAARSVLTNS